MYMNLDLVAKSRRDRKNRMTEICGLDIIILKTMLQASKMSGGTMPLGAGDG